jgi:hypothetical protein
VQVLGYAYDEVTCVSRLTKFSGEAMLLYHQSQKEARHFQRMRRGPAVKEVDVPRVSQDPKPCQRSLRGIVGCGRMIGKVA